MKKEIIEIRKVLAEIEAHIEQMQEKAESMQMSRDLLFAYQNACSARHWLGEALGDLGEESPYKN